MSGRILVTGGLGYLGGRLCRHLAENAGWTVRIASRRPATAQPDWAKRFEVRAAEPAGFDALCRDVDAIVHLAGSNEHAAAADPVQALQDTAGDTARLLDAAKRNGVGRFVYFSTIHVYGAPLVGRIDEATLPRPGHPYAISHRAAEDFVLAAHRRGDLAGLVFRLSNGFGAPADPGVDRWTLLINDLCRQAATAGRLTLNSDGSQLRDFIALADVSAATTHVLGLPTAAWVDGLFNLGGGQSQSVLNMANQVAARCGGVLGTVPPIDRPATATDAEPTADLDYRIDKLAATGWRPIADVDAEIDATLRLCLTAFGQDD